ncbi:hypothetical protein [Ancylobacter sp. IITR112]|uniref:hypothetical protein n=1 Tax=Ancylobacter sp. IITR112 TaxID=3138073 RepID=UPI00352B925E
MADTERLRGDIDEGRTHDKVPFPDPAAAPLGTDDEAAGAPAETERAMVAQVIGPSSAGGGTDERGRPYDDKGTTVPGVSFVTAVVGLLLVVALGAGVFAAVMMG